MGYFLCTILYIVIFPFLYILIVSLTLDLEYFYHIKDKNKNITINIKEQIFCFKIEDIIELLEKHNFKIINIFSYLKEKLDENDWNIGIICQKK